MLKSKKLTSVLVLLSMVVLAGCQPAVEDEETQETPKNVRVMELQPDTLAEFFEITGPVAPVKGADISAQESGPVVRLQATKGQVLKHGAPILELERKILQAEMESANAALETQAYNLDKVQQLYDAGKVSRIELLNTTSQFQAASSMAKINQERYQRALISAPFDCVVTDRYVELGQMVMPGQPVVRCIDPYTLKLEAHLTDKQVAWARVGTPAEVKLGQLDELAAGMVSWVGMEADVRTGKFKVEVEIPNPDLKYRSGVIGRARITKNVIQQVVTIPRDAVIKGRHGPEVFVIEADRAHRLPITLGPDQGRMVIVTGGLEAGQMLVVRGHRDLVEGGLVSIVETATQPDGSLDGDPSIVRRDDSGGKR